MTFPMQPDPTIRRITDAVKRVQAIADDLYPQTDGAPEPYNAYGRIEDALREVTNDLVLLDQLRVTDEVIP